MNLVFILIFLAFAYLVIKLAYCITGENPIELIFEFVYNNISKLQGVSGKRYIKNKVKFAQMSSEQKKENRKYRFYLFLNEILLDLGWTSNGVTAEGFELLIQLICIGGAVAMLVFTKNPFFTLFVSAIAYVLLFAIFFLLSRINHIKRKNALMDAEDLICSSISQGVVRAIEDNLSVFNPLVQPIFMKFYDEVQNRNVDIDTALDHLNFNAGQQFDSFCEKAKIFERERRPGMEIAFNYNITRNVDFRELDRDCTKAFNEMNFSYFMCIGVLVLFLLMSMFSFVELREFYQGSIGKALLLFFAAAASIVFIFIQYLQSKPFLYGSNKRKRSKLTPAEQIAKMNESLAEMYGSAANAREKFRNRKQRKETPNV